MRAKNEVMKNDRQGKIQRMKIIPGIKMDDTDSATWERGAVFSDCLQYRYSLWRIWDKAKPTVAFVLLNPSTADADNNDPTVERCQKRALAMNFGGIFVANIFALRSTDPSLLYGHKDPVGEGNDAAINKIVSGAGAVICGWGSHGVLNRRGHHVLDIIKSQNKIPLCLGVTKGGLPKHPLYIGYNVNPVAMEIE